MYNFDEIIDRSNTNSVKYGVSKMMYPGLPDGYIPMWIADMDFACPQPILDAMKARLDKRILGYSMVLDPEYFAALAGWMKNRHNWEVDPSTSLFSSGVVPALNVAVQMLTKETDGVLLNTPAYHPFDDAIKKYGRRPVYSRLLCSDGRYEIDWEDFEAKAKDPNVTLYFLCNPHNPTGRVWRKEELRRIGEICFANNVFVVSDEIHFDFIRAGIEHTVFASLFPGEKRIITCTAPSKTFNLAGNQLSNIFFADTALQQQWQSAQVFGQPNPLSIDACKAAYTQCAGWLDELNAYLDENFRHFAQRIRDELPDVRFTIPESTYLAWVDVSGTGLSRQELALRMIKAGLHIEFEDEFVDNGEGHVRMNLACPRSLIDRAVDAMVKAIGPGTEPPTPRVKVGDVLSDFTVDTPWQRGVSLSRILDGKPAMLLFLRYNGCPLCQLDMHEIAAHYDLIEAAGGRVAVVLQSDPDKLKEQLKSPDALPYAILCDPEKKLYQRLAVWPAAGQMELMGPGLMEKMKQAQAQGIQHGDYEGDEMQLPAAFAVDGDGRVAWVHYGRGLADTPAPAQIAEILKGIVSQ